MDTPDWVTPRRVLAAVVLALLVPVAVAGLTYSPPATADIGNGSGPPVEDLTIVTMQGGDGLSDQATGGIEIVNTTSKERVWSHYECQAYYDVEPVDNATVLVTAQCPTDSGNHRKYALEVDWRANEIERLLRVPRDAHDIDRLGPHRYAVADIIDDAAYVYNYTAGDYMDAGMGYDGVRAKDSWKTDHAWEFEFRNHYPGPPLAGGGRGGYTHLNDIDPVDNGSAFLLSPRNFDRVMAVNRSTKAVEWTLGQQDDPAILAGQHHPVVIEDDPLTVLVGDSLNHRAVEYRRLANGSEPADPDAVVSSGGDRWERTWVYAEGLNWPRSVTRLPDGNTLVADSGNDRALEVTPNGSVVWEYTPASPHIYDVVRYGVGEEPDGPTMAAVLNGSSAPGSSGGVSLVEKYHRYAGFVLPIWVGEWEFVALVLAGTILIGWTLTEVGLRVRRWL